MQLVKQSWAQRSVRVGSCLSVSVLALALSGALLPQAAFAQPATAKASEPAPSSAEISEVVVTALKGSLGVQDTPATVVVTTGETLAERNITSVDQLTQVVPGLSFQAPTPGLYTATVRGLSSSPSNQSFEQTVGLFVDGIFAGHPRDYTAALFDIENVQLLKGTQSAVLGKNTSVGAIAVTTKRPSPVFGYDLSYQHEFVLDSDTLSGAVNIPLSDTVAIRLAAINSETGGWVKYRLSGADAPNTTRRGLRGTLRWEPTEHLTWDLAAQATYFLQKGLPLVIEQDLQGRVQAYANAFGGGPLVIGGNISDQTPRPGYAFNGRVGENPSDESEAQRYTSTFAYDFEGVKLSAVTGYSTYDVHYTQGFALPQNAQLRAQAETDESFSQEIVLATPEERRISMLGGVYYYRDKWTVNQIQDNLAAPGFTAGGAVRNYYNQRIRSISGFGQVSAAITDQLHLVAGARYDHARKDGYFERELLRAGTIANNNQSFAPTSLSRKEALTTYTVNARYEFNPDLMVYVGYFTGGKPGGFQFNPSTPSTAPYQAEKSKTVALGAKTQLLGRGHLNAELFRTDIKDFQFSFFNAVRFIVRNDQVRSQGLDVDFDYPLTQNLTIGAAVTYAKVTKTVPVANSINGLPWAPRWTGVGRIAYTRPVSDGIDLQADLDVQFRTRQYLNDAVTFGLPFSEGYEKVNARVALAFDKGWRVAVVGKNLTKERVVNYAVPLQSIAGGVYALLDAPRTVALEVSVRR